MRPTRRPFPVWALLIVVTVALGLASRRFGGTLPDFVAAYSGDTLWAAAAFFGLGALLPKTSTWKVAAQAFLLAVAVELSQLYHAPWIDSVRRTTIGGLILGFGFLWSDIACYAVGVALGVIAEETLDMFSSGRLMMGSKRPPARPPDRPATPD